MSTHLLASSSFTQLPVEAQVALVIMGGICVIAFLIWFNVLLLDNKSGIIPTIREAVRASRAHQMRVFDCMREDERKKQEMESGDRLSLTHRADYTALQENYRQVTAQLANMTKERDYFENMRQKQLQELSNLEVDLATARNNAKASEDAKQHYKEQLEALQKQWDAHAKDTNEANNLMVSLFSRLGIPPWPNNATRLEITQSLADKFEELKRKCTQFEQEYHAACNRNVGLITARDTAHVERNEARQAHMSLEARYNDLLHELAELKMSCIVRARNRKIDVVIDVKELAYKIDDLYTDGLNKVNWAEYDHSTLWQSERTLPKEHPDDWHTVGDHESLVKLLQDNIVALDRDQTDQIEWTKEQALKVYGDGAVLGGGRCAAASQAPRPRR